MTAMTTHGLLPRSPGGWRVADLKTLPDDGLQYELLDGMLLVSPAPVRRHQRIVVQLAVRLQAVCPPDLEVLVAPLDWQPDDRTSLQPDVLVARADPASTARNITEVLQLAVEVLSPSSVRKDRMLKFSRYQQAGIPAYWLIDPDEPALVAYDLRDGQYVEVARAEGSEVASLQRPFRVEIVPAELI